MLELIVTNVHEQLFHDNVVSVTLPGSTGELTVLAHHEPFVTTLQEGSIRIRKEKNGGYQNISVERGILEVSNNRATVLV